MKPRLHTEFKGDVTIDGDTVLKGRVLLEKPQGDISMGIYE